MRRWNQSVDVRPGRARYHEIVGQATSYTGLSRKSLGRYRAAADPIPWLVNSLESDARAGRATRWSAGYALTCSFPARCLAEIGKFPEARAFGERGLARAETSGNPFHLVAACLGLGFAHLHKGDFAHAIGQFGRGPS